MSDHWRLALRYSAWLLGAAVLISAALLFVYGGGHAWSFFYGAGAAILSFVSTALTISLFAGRSMAAGVMIGAGSFVVRLAFAAAVLGIPAYLGLWPVVPMLVGFAGVYVAENVAATVRVARTRNEPSANLKAQGSAREEAGRRVGN
jgi:F0F1-type ATP synthase assembly protein I